MHFLNNSPLLCLLYRQIIVYKEGNSLCTFFSFSRSECWKTVLTTNLELFATEENEKNLECWEIVLATNLKLFVTDENENYLFPIIIILYCHRVSPCTWLTHQRINEYHVSHQKLTLCFNCPSRWKMYQLSQQLEMRAMSLESCNLSQDLAM